MGFAVPAAIGAKVGMPERMVWAVDGDGCFQMTAQELVTASAEQIPVKIAILNNAYLGMVRQWQELFWDGKYSHVETGEFPDFVKLAEAYGATGMRFESKKTLVEDMKRAIATDGPVVVDVRVTREENTYPMIPAGQAAREMVG
jgi:acetolactate synthase-1/2/3 large subunit